MRLYDDLENTYIREVETRAEKKATIYLILLVFSLIFFGYFGIIRGIISISEKSDLIKELDLTIENLNLNLEKIATLEPILDSEEVSLLHKSITTKPERAAFMEMVVKTASRNGFVVEKVVFEGVPSEYVSNSDIATITISGTTNKLTPFLSELHDVLRLNSLERVRMNIKKNTPGEYTVNISTSIYNVEE